MLGEYGATLSDLKAEHIWLLPELADGGLFGGDDGQGGWAPLAVATPTATGGTQIAWVYGDHLGVPLLAMEAGGQQLALSGFAVQGFPGQRRTLPDLYYNRYRDYDPTTGRYIQADPIGLAGGALEGGMQAYDNWNNGRDVLDPNCYDWFDIGVSAVIGGVSPGLSQGFSRSKALYRSIKRGNRYKNLTKNPKRKHYWSRRMKRDLNEFATDFAYPYGFWQLIKFGGKSSNGNEDCKCQK